MNAARKRAIKECLSDLSAIEKDGAKLERMIKRLPERSQLVIKLRRDEGMGYFEIGEQFGQITNNQASHIYHQALIYLLRMKVKIEKEDNAKKEEELFGKSITELMLGIRSENALLFNEIKYINQLTKMSPAELLRCRGFGRSCLIEVMRRLQAIGLNLSGENTI